jgi:hypothetical protein
VLAAWHEDPEIVEEAWERWEARHEVGLAAGPGPFVEMMYDVLRERRNGRFRPPSFSSPEG